MVYETLACRIVCTEAIVFLVVHFWLGWPLFPVWICLGIWVIYALFVTAVISMANHAGNEPAPERPNKNPYSKTNADYHYDA